MKFLLYFFFFGFFFHPFLARAETIDKIVAKVGSEVITLSDISQAIAEKRAYLYSLDNKEKASTDFEKFKNDILNEMILDIILRAEIVKEAITMTDAAVDEEFNNRLKQSGLSAVVFANKLAAQGFSILAYKKKLKEEMEKQAFIQKKIMPHLSVSDYDLQQEYEKSISKFQVYNKLHFIEVYLTPAKFATSEELFSMARTIREKMVKGQNVTDLIKNFSSGAFAQKGGDSGDIKGSDIRSEIQETLSQLKPGETSQLFPSSEGVFIFKLITKADPQPIPFNKVASLLRMRYGEKMILQDLKKYLLAVKDETYVEILK